MFRVLLLGSLVLLLSTCKKEELQLVIEGVIWDPNQQIPVVGADVKLAAQEISGGTFNNNFNSVASATTNSSGGFQMTIARKTVAEYRFRTSKNGYFDNEVFIVGDQIQPDAPYNIQIENTPKAYYALRLQNNSPVNSNDRISYRNMNAVLECECCNNNLITVIGDDIDTTFTCVHEGEVWLKYFFEIEKNNVTTMEFDSIFLPSFDTTYNHLTY